MTTSEARHLRFVTAEDQTEEDRVLVNDLKTQGYSNLEVGERMGITESSVRLLASK